MKDKQVRAQYPASLACEVLEVSASGYFNWLRRSEAGSRGHGGRKSDEAVLTQIRAIHAEVKGEYGWPRMHKELLAQGIRVGKDRIRKLMQQHGNRAKTKRKFVVTTDSRHSLPVAPDLVQRRFNPRRPTRSGVVTFFCPLECRLAYALHRKKPPARPRLKSRASDRHARQLHWAQRRRRARGQDPLARDARPVARCRSRRNPLRGGCSGLKKITSH